MFDKQVCTDNEEEKAHYQGLIDLLTPVFKSYCSDRGFDICVEAVQVYGGYGYTCEYPVEQLLRDCKIASIYEGTNGIQAMDLLGRKLGMKGGAVFLNFFQQIQKTTAEAAKIESLKALAAKLDEAVKRLGEVAMQLGTTAMSPDVKVAFAFAKPFLDVAGDVCTAWMLLWRATIAVQKLEKAAKNKDTAFYEGQLQTAKYFINSILPITMGKMDAIQAADPLTPYRFYGGQYCKYGGYPPLVSPGSYTLRPKNPFCSIEKYFWTLDIKTIHVYYTCNFRGGVCDATEAYIDHRRGGL